MNYQNKRTLKLTIVFILTVIIVLLCLPLIFRVRSHIARAEIPFKGNATGGTLIIGYIQNPHHVHFTNVSINTSPGESAETVVSRLARAVVDSDGIFGRTSADPNVALSRIARGSTLSIVGSNRNYFLAGTESGLGIPKPPLSLSCSYNEEIRTIDVMWINPQDVIGYDLMYIIWRYRNRPEDTPDSGGGKIILGAPTNFIIKVPEDVDDLDADIWIKGFHHEMPVEELRNRIPMPTNNAIPSNVTAIHITSNGYCLEETYGIPFTAGIAPNWDAWSTAVKVEKTAFEPGNKYVGIRLYDPVKGLLTKPFYQVIKASHQGVAHGIYRKFLGLTPGHSYRITACINTLEMDSINRDWSLSLCAAHNGSNGNDLTVRQLAGFDALPNGRIGTEAGRIAFYNNSNTTKKDFSIVVSGDNSTGGPQSSIITLPAGADTITVWVRFKCAEPKGKIAFSGVKLEDISALSNPKSPEQIILDEKQKEAHFIKRVGKVLGGV